MTHNPHRLGQRPARVSIRRKPTMINNKFRRVQRIHQILIILRQHARLHHTLINNRPRRKTRHIKLPIIIIPHQTPRPPLHIKPPPHQIQRPLKPIPLLLIRITQSLRRLHKKLPHGRRRGPRQITQHRHVHGDFTPTDQVQFVQCQNVLHNFFERVSSVGIAGEEDHADSWGGAGGGGVFGEEFPRDLCHYSRAVAGDAVAAAGAAVFHAGEAVQALLEDFVGAEFSAIHISHKSDTTSISLPRQSHGPVKHIRRLPFFQLESHRQPRRPRRRRRQLVVFIHILSLQ
mmetsp:Transcript_58812/g.70143  ORF Transcript_58812/g.70143 Transcript_58812/m.70143 type:complete len:288 (-) Transcript_58812:346-1209(-)